MYIHIDNIKIDPFFTEQETQLDRFKMNMSLHIIKYKKHVCSENFSMHTSV